MKVAMTRVLQERVLGRLGFQKPPAATLEGLRAVYRAWCQGVPFDNVRKMIALRTDGATPLPGGGAVDFFENWLAHGAGGTCWPTSNALCELLRSLGFEARRVGGSMRDLGAVNHGSTKVSIGARDWLVDSSLLSNVPLPLDGEEYIGADTVFPMEVELDGPTHLVWAHLPPLWAWLPCRLIEDGLSHAFFLARYEESRARSPFNQRLYARRNRPSEMLVLAGNTRFSKTADGTESRDLSPEDVCEALRHDIGLSRDLIEEWARSGALAASFEPPAGPQPPPLTRKPPSQRR